MEASSVIIQHLLGCSDLLRLVSSQQLNVTTELGSFTMCYRKV